MGGVVYRTPARSERERRQRAGFRRWFEVYDCAAESWKMIAELETYLWDAELAEYKLTNPPPNLKDYMIATAGQPRC